MRFREVFDKINRFFSKPVIVAAVTVIAAVAGGIAGAAYASKTTESEISKLIRDELHLMGENEGLAQTIEDIKKELRDRDLDLSEEKSKVKELENELSNTASLREQLEVEKSAKESAESKLAEYVFSTPELTIDGNKSSVDKDDFLFYNNKLYFGSSILRHFFDENHLIYKDGRLDITTEGTKAPVNPILENGIDLLSMETTQDKSSYIGTDAIMDNSGTLHNTAIYSKANGTNTIEYRLDKSYKWFTCNAFVTKDGTNESYDSDIWNKASVTITTDSGVYLWGTKSISRDSEVQESDVLDISGVKYIKISFSNAGTGPSWSPHGTPILAIGEPRLYLE